MWGTRSQLQAVVIKTYQSETLIPGDALERVGLRIKSCQDFPVMAGIIPKALPPQMITLVL